MNQNMNAPTTQATLDVTRTLVRLVIDICLEEDPQQHTPWAYQDMAEWYADIIRLQTWLAPCSVRPPDEAPVKPRGEEWSL